MQGYTHSCKVCGKQYKTCNACNEIKSFETWRNIACSIECYQMWMTLFEFNRGAIAAKHAKEYLATFEFAGKEFGEDVKAVLAKIDEEAAKAEETKVEIEPVKTLSSTPNYKHKKKSKRNAGR